MNLKTLSTIARDLGANVNTLKAFVYRVRPDLTELGQRVGTSLAYDAAAAAKIGEAFSMRRKCARAVTT